MHWYWNHSADELWRQIDPALWALTENPWVVLQTVSRDQLRRALADPASRANLSISAFNDELVLMVSAIPVALPTMFTISMALGSLPSPWPRRLRSSVSALFLFF